MEEATMRMTLHFRRFLFFGLAFPTIGLLFYLFLENWYEWLLYLITGN